MTERPINEEEILFLVSMAVGCCLGLFFLSHAYGAARQQAQHCAQAGVHKALEPVTQLGTDGVMRAVG